MKDWDAPVSYTHLDVYKRQVHTGQQWVLGAPPNAVVQAQKILLLVASST